jgi:FkbM family methyltransferase
MSNSPKYSPLTRAMLLLYSSVKRTGLLESRVAKRLFLASYFLYKRYFEDPFFKFSRIHPELFEGGIVLDVGANCGYTSQVFAQTKATHVYAFEPDGENIATLTKVLSARNLLSRVTAMQAAVGAENGAVDLWFNVAHHADHRIATDAFKNSNQACSNRLVRVPMVTLDSFVSDLGEDTRVSFIKIDVQGFELPVCQGMLGILDRFEDVTCALEYCPIQIEELGFSAPAVLNLFESRGFKLFIMDSNGALRLCEPVALAALLSARGYVDLIATRRMLPVGN